MATINGTSGSDLIIGGTTSDTINAGDGNDVVYAGGGNDAVNAGNGNDTVYGEGGNDTIDAGNGNDIVYGGAGNDTIFGTEGNDQLFGDDGDDILDGGKGNDKVYGGSGNDRILVSADNDTIDGGTGIDTIDASAFSQGITINLSTGLMRASGNTNVAGLENVIGSRFADVITGDSGDNVLNGNGGNDVVSGGAGNDTLIANNGNSTYYGGDGNDKLVFTAGTTGTQAFVGGAGSDTLQLIVSSAQLTPAMIAELTSFAAFSANAANAGVAFQFSVIGNLAATGADVLSLIVDGVPCSLADFINHAPVIDSSSASSLSVGHGKSVAGSVVATDADGDQLQYSVQGSAAHGTVTLDASTGKYIYTAGDYVGSDTFTVRVADGHGGFADHVVNVGLTNTGPVISSASATSLSVGHGKSVSGSVTATDADGDQLQYSVQGSAAHGTVTLDASTGKYIYTAGDYVGSDTFTVRVADGHGGFADHVVNVGLTNTGPVISATSATSLSVGHGKSVSGSVTATDADGDDYSFSITTGPQHGTLVFTDATGSYIYKADDYVGFDNFTVRVSDGHGGFADHTVSVNATNIGPAIDTARSTSSISTLYGTSVTGSVFATDGDGDSVTYTLKSGPANGSVFVDASGNFTFNAVDAAGTDKFVITASDGHGGTVDHVVNVGVIGTLDTSAAATAVNINLGAGTATGVEQGKLAWAINVVGSMFNDILYGDGRNNILRGGAGKDELHGMAGNDSLDGGVGDDKVFGEDGNDTLGGGDGNDTLNGGAGTDTMRGGIGNDGFFGGGADDRLYGEDGDDRIYGDGGNDIISGGRGNDIMTGAGINNAGVKGANTYLWERGDVVNSNGSKAGFFDHITDFGVGDKLDFTGLVSNHPSAAHDLVRVTDTASGLVVAVDMGGTTGFVDVVILDNVHGLTVDDLDHSGSIII